MASSGHTTEKKRPVRQLSSQFEDLALEQLLTEEDERNSEGIRRRSKPLTVSTVGANIAEEDEWNGDGIRPRPKLATVAKGGTAGDAKTPNVRWGEDCFFMICKDVATNQILTVWGNFEGKMKPNGGVWPTAHLYLFEAAYIANRNLFPVAAGGIKDQELNKNSAFNDPNFAAQAKVYITG